MELQGPLATVERLIEQGRFLEAEGSLVGLDGHSPHDPSFGVLRGELSLELGRIQEAKRACETALKLEASPGLLARAHRVLARTEFYTGDAASTIKHLNVARELCERAALRQEHARVELARLALFSGLEPLESTYATLPGVRRVVVQAAAPLLLAELRLCLARAEARRRSPHDAQRHLDMAAELLASTPNLWLEGLWCLDRSNVDGLLGDLDSSLQHAQRAIDLAGRSGHFRTRVAAEINLSHILCWRSDYQAATTCVEHALAKAEDNKQLLRAALDSKANILISTNRFDECAAVLSLVRLLDDAAGARLHWDRLTEIGTQARLAQARGDWRATLTEVDSGLALARECGDRLWTRRLHFTRAKCLARLGKSTASISEISKGSAIDAPQAESVAQFYGALGAASDSHSRKRQHLGRAVRVCAAMRNSALADDICAGVEPGEPINSLATALPSTDLDSAVALLDLGAHPHILAREAVAVLEATGCTSAMALLAGTGATTRVIEARGWDERQALAAARRSDTLDVIPLGTYRDEPWQILVEPRPALDDRCTLIAVRKLIATATTLDRYRREEKQRAALWPAEALDGDPDSIWASTQMAELLGIARRIAPTPLSVLLTGETGTGKEMLARTIHRASDRADRIFLPFNCTAGPRDMIESQLFGYRKGAFTGAETSFAGVIRSAAGGTLFLDEIAEVPVDLQPKLLRFLESREIHPLGEPQPLKVDVRVIAATNAPLEQLVADGRLREDLFYRLNVVQLKLPPLRERREEIPPLVEHYLRKFADEQKKGMLPLSDEALEYLLLYSWPGNVRQLANEIHRVVAMAEPGATVTPAMLSPEIRASRRTIPAASAAEPEIRLRIDQPLPDAVELLEQTMVRNALDRSHGRVEEAARLLGISRKGLFLKRRRWGLGQRAS